MFMDGGNYFDVAKSNPLESELCLTLWFLGHSEIEDTYLNIGAKEQYEIMFSLFLAKRIHFHN